jgi:hypothetical protein
VEGQIEVESRGRNLEREDQQVDEVKASIVVSSFAAKYGFV